MATLIPILSNFILAAIALYDWRKYKDRNFLFIFLFVCVGIGASLLALSDRYYFRFALPSINLSIAAVWFYYWIKFGHKNYLWISVLNLLVVLMGIYGLFIAKIDLSLPLPQWSISAYIFLVVLLFALVALTVL